jgi:hypothetical protein
MVWKGSGGADETMVEGLVRNVALGRSAPTRDSVWGARARPEHMLLLLAAKEGGPLSRPAIRFRPGYPAITIAFLAPNE